jgi:hypothetical protein
VLTAFDEQSIIFRPATFGGGGEGDLWMSRGLCRIDPQGCGGARAPSRTIDILVMAGTSGFRLRI